MTRTASRTAATKPAARPRTRLGAWPVVLAVLALAFAALGVAVGPRDIGITTTWDALVAFDASNTEHLLVIHQRLPRSLLGLLVGLCLGVAGAVMQALTRNPLAEPGLLGVNAGAASAIVLGIVALGATSATAYMALGMLGAAIAGTLVVLLGDVRRGTNPVRVVLAGVALTVVLSATTHVVLLNSDERVYDSYRQWVVGSLAGRGFEVLMPVLAVAIVGLAAALALGRSLDAATLGDELARSLGANPARTWAFAGVTVIVLAGAATAAAGPIVFLGLVTPHLARLLVGVGTHRVLITSGLIGAALTAGADAIGRVVVPKGEVGVGIMIALIGGPFFVHLVRQRTLARL